MNPAAAISGICPVSPGGENPVMSETPAVTGGPGLIEWLADCSRKALIFSRFLFE
jgi:hypothetical protein